MLRRSTSFFLKIPLSFLGYARGLLFTLSNTFSRLKQMFDVDACLYQVLSLLEARKFLQQMHLSQPALILSVCIHPDALSFYGPRVCEHILHTLAKEFHWHTYIKMQTKYN